ncbi:hypothetical protein Q5752_001431 [Cryptotrichosporon argae]
MPPQPQPKPGLKPLPPVAVHFLGTCSGGGPIVSRNCSSTAVDFGNDIWLFDAADGTNLRMHQSPLRMSNISRVFVTHMHADHVLGIVAILGVIMSGVGQTEAGLARLRAQGLDKQASINLYGPVGLRRFIRTALELTAITLTGVLAVHELLPAAAGATRACGSAPCDVNDLHVNEAVGRDIAPSPDGVWEVIPEGGGKDGKGWRVVAGPLTHRVPSIGYVLVEPTPHLPLDAATLIPLLQSNAAALAAQDPPIRHPLSLLSHLASVPSPPPLTLPSGDVLHPPAPSGVAPRKLVIFGDCDGGSPNAAFVRACADASLLVHECTNAAVPERIGKGARGARVRASGLEQSLERKRDEEFRAAAQERGEPPGGHWGEKPESRTLAGPSRGTSREDEEEADKRKKEEVGAKAKKRGHATPQLVGAFAASIRARRVAVNHFSAMFPSPRYASTAPLPSLLDPISPHPYPTPELLLPSPSLLLSPAPLHAQELHMRLIMQSLADQITAAWHGAEDAGGAGGPGADATVRPSEAGVRHVGQLSLDAGPPPTKSAGGADRLFGKAQAIPARDFMVLPVPAHELAPWEIEDAARARQEADTVMRAWADEGGAWVGQGDARVWVGLEPRGRRA